MVLRIYLLALTLIFAAGTALAKPLSKEDICEPTRGDGPKKAFWLTTGEFPGNDYVYVEIPTTYLHRNDELIIGNYKHHRAARITVRLTDFSPFYAGSFSNYSSNKIPIMLKSFVSMKEVLSTFIMSGSRNSTAKINTYEIVDYDFGLSRVNYEVQPRFGKDTFFSEKNDKIQTVISCKNSLGENPLPNPQCRQIFEQGSVDISFYYDVELLPYWRDFQSNVETLVSCLATDIRETLPENIRK